MRVRTNPPGPFSTLSRELKTILLDGPFVLGKTLRDLPPHDDLRALWRQHEAALLAAARKRRKPAWFLDRDLLVRKVRGEP